MSQPQLLAPDYVEKYSETVERPWRHGAYTAGGENPSISTFGPSIWREYSYQTYTDGANEYSAPSYSEDFQAFLNQMNAIRIELADGKYDKLEACFQVMRIAKEYGLESFFTLSGDTLETSLVSKICDEIEALHFKHAVANEQEWHEESRSVLNVDKTTENKQEIRRQIDKDLSGLPATLTLAPPTDVNFGKVLDEVMETIEGRTGLTGAFTEGGSLYSETREHLGNVVNNSKTTLRHHHIRFVN